jgi:3-oxoacyl-[acyl-carrier protein] reductase
MMKTILVTGVSQGLGLEIARAILEAGWSVYGTSRRHSEDYQELQHLHGDRAKFLAVDLAEPASLKEQIFGPFLPARVPLHGLVNNAAVAYDDLVSNLDVTRLRAMYELNVFTPMVLSREVIRNMLLNRVAGSLVHISSVSVHTGYKGLAMYASTKGALEAFSKNTAREWGERGIRSNCVVAGFMETAMSSKLTFAQKEKIYQRTALKQPTGPGSVAAAVLYLLGEGAASVTGQNIVVDAGTF